MVRIGVTKYRGVEENSTAGTSIHPHIDTPTHLFCNIKGGVAERLKAAVLKTVVRRKVDRGFESLLLRQYWNTVFPMQVP